MLTALDGVSRRPWSRAQRVFFRFAFIYWVLYLTPTHGAASLLDLLPLWPAQKLRTILSAPFYELVPWIGKHWFHLAGLAAEWHPTGSGDTALQYVRLFLIALFTVVIGTAWSIFSELRERRSEYDTAYRWLRFAIRFTLAITLLEYGFMKLFPIQFQRLDMLSLTETYGESTPMHLLWSLMGQSRTYMIFGGVMEVAPGILLLFRRTSAVGAMAAIAVLGNVVALNFSFDVPVKLYSLNLLLMAIFLLLPDFTPLWRLLILGRERQVREISWSIKDHKALHVGSKILFVLICLGIFYNVIWRMHKEVRNLSLPPSPLEGAYAPEQFTGDPVGDTIKRVVIENRWLILAGEKKNYWYGVQYNTDDRIMTLTATGLKGILHWSHTNNGLLMLAGRWNGKPVELLLIKTNPQQFELNKPSFHWIQEIARNH